MKKNIFSFAVLFLVFTLSFVLVSQSTMAGVSDGDGWAVDFYGNNDEGNEVLKHDVSFSSQSDVSDQSDVPMPVSSEKHNVAILYDKDLDDDSWGCSEEEAIDNTWVDVYYNIYNEKGEFVSGDYVTLDSDSEVVDTEEYTDTWRITYSKEFSHTAMESGYSVGLTAQYWVMNQSSGESKMVDEWFFEAVGEHSGPDVDFDDGTWSYLPTSAFLDETLDYSGDITNSGDESADGEVRLYLSNSTDDVYFTGTSYTTDVGETISFDRTSGHELDDKVSPGTYDVKMELLESGTVVDTLTFDDELTVSDSTSLTLQDWEVTPDEDTYYDTEELTFSGDVVNDGDYASDVVVELLADGSKIDSKDIDLASDEVRPLSFDYTPLDYSGEYDFEIQVWKGTTLVDSRTFPIDILETPEVNTVDSTVFDSTSAELEGEVTDFGDFDSPSCAFEYKKSSDSSWNIIGGGVEMSSTGTYAMNVTALEENTDYDYRAECGSGASYGDVKTFTTPGDLVPPTVETGNATNIYAKNATLNGQLTDAGTHDGDLTCWFDYRNTSTDEWIYTMDDVSVAEGESFSIDVTELYNDTDYEYRAACEGDGEDTGDVETFSTTLDSDEPVAPTVVLESASGPTVYNINESCVSVQAHLTDYGTSSDVSCWFEWKKDSASSWSSTTPLSTVIEGDYFTGELTGLQSLTLYDYKAVCESPDGESETDVDSFTTEGDDLYVETDDATNITNTSAVLNGDLVAIDSDYPSTEVSFFYRPVGGSWSESVVGITEDATTFDKEVTGLDSSTEYEYYTEASNDNNTVTGETETFTTLEDMAADFNVSLISISPTGAEKELYETLTFNARVFNNGNNEETKDVDLAIDERSNVVDSSSVTLSPGEDTEVTFTWLAESTGDHTAYTMTGDSEDSADFTVYEETDDDDGDGSDGGSTADPAHFDIRDYDAASTVTQGSSIDADFTVKNTGDEEGTQDIEVTFNGSSVFSQPDLTLSSGEIKDFDVSTNQTDISTGTYELVVSSDDDTETRYVDVESSGTPIFQTDIVGSNVPQSGETLEVDYSIENTGEESGTKTIEFYFDGAKKDENNVTLDADESYGGTFSYSTTESAGDYNISVVSPDDTANSTATITSGAHFVVDVLEANSPYEGEDFVVDYEVENVGNETDTQKVRMFFGSRYNLVDRSDDITLAGGEKTNGTLTYTTSKTPGLWDYWLATDDHEVRSAAAIQGKSSGGGGAGEPSQPEQTFSVKPEMVSNFFFKTYSYEEDFTLVNKNSYPVDVTVKFECSGDDPLCDWVSFEKDREVKEKTVTISSGSEDEPSYNFVNVYADTPAEGEKEIYETNVVFESDDMREVSKYQLRYIALFSNFGSSSFAIGVVVAVISVAILTGFLFLIGGRLW